MENIENTEGCQGLIAISKCLARAKDGMTMQEKKLMAIYLSKIEWTKPGNNREIWIDKTEIIDLLNSKMNPEDQPAYLRKLAENMAIHSQLRFDKADKNKGWTDIFLFTTRDYSNGKLMVKINEDAMALLEGLHCEYITMFLSDILKLDSSVDGRRAYTLYEYLRSNCDTRKICSHTLTTKKIKELFDIPKDGKGSYMQYDAKKGKDVFNRTKFEERVIIPTLKMLSRCEHVVLHNYGMDEKGEPILYQKVKDGNTVVGYEVSYSINKRPRSIKRETLIDVQENPEVLKVAQDILENKKNPKKENKNINKFNDFEQRKYSSGDISDLEKLLLGSPQ